MTTRIYLNAYDITGRPLYALINSPDPGQYQIRLEAHKVLKHNGYGVSQRTEMIDEIIRREFDN